MMMVVALRLHLGGKVARELADVKGQRRRYTDAARIADMLRSTGLLGHPERLAGTPGTPATHEALSLVLRTDLTADAG